MQGEGKSFMSLFKIHNLPDIENVNIKGIFAELFKADKVKRRMKNNHFIKDWGKNLVCAKGFWKLWIFSAIRVYFFRDAFKKI